MMAVIGVIKKLFGIGVPQTKFDLLRGSATFLGGPNVPHREKG
jgi:hypothetical protein